MPPKTKIAAEMGATSPKMDVNSSLPRFGGKREVAELIGMSLRSVDNYMAQGLPHLKLTARKTRFDLVEVAVWFKTQFTTQRIGRAKG